jgi:type I restriction enzyme S subunit
MNATLEGMAQALFKSWFVDFDPVIDNALAAGNPIPEELAPRAEVRRQALASSGEPSRTNSTTQQGSADHSTLSDPKSLFPAAFEFTEELGWIPEGWTLQSFESLATLDTESVKPFEQPATVWEHYSIPSYDSAGMPSWDRGDEIKSNKYRVKPGAILSSKLNPETERTWWPFMVDEEAAICSTEFMQFVPKNLSEQAFVYSLIRSAPFQSNILERVTGSTGSRQRAQPKEIAKIGVLGSGESLRAEFVKVALPLFQSIRNNSLRNQTLTKLRDTLLPKLISGDLGLPEAEQLTEEALT